MSLNNYASAEQIFKERGRLFKPPLRKSVSEVVTQNVNTKLPNGNWGAWDSTLTPYMVEPLNLCNSRKYRGVIFMGPARTGKSQALVDGFTGFDAVADPSDLLIIQITSEKAAEFSKKRIGPMFENSPALKHCLSKRRHDNNIHDRILRAGNYHKIAHPAKSVLASSDFRRVIITDYDRSPELLDVGGEGEGFGLALKRTQTFGTRGMCVAESSPGYEVIEPDWKPNADHPHESPPAEGIASLYNQGDRRVLYWPCPFCGEFFPARFEYLRWDTNETDPVAASETTSCFCPKCGCADITPNFKYDMVQASRWVPEGMTIDRDGNLSGHARKTSFASFWMEGPAAGFQTWQQLVLNYLQAMQVYDQLGSQEKLKSTVNTDQGRPYARLKAGNSRSAEGMQARSEAHRKLEVPSRVRFLLATVDVQGGKKRRWVVQVHGYGPTEAGDGTEEWLIDRYNITETTNADGETVPVHPGAHPEDWKILTDKVVRRSYALADNSGRRMPVLMTAIDTGGEDGVTANAVNYWRELRRQGLHQRVMLVKGASSLGAAPIRETFPDSSKRADRKGATSGDVPIWQINTNLLKDEVETALSREGKGAGFVHFPDWLGKWFFEELCAEERDTKGRWAKVSNRQNNEAFDLFVYARAAFRMRGGHKIVWGNEPRWAMPHDENPELLTGGEIATEIRPKRRRARRTRAQFK